MKAGDLLPNEVHISVRPLVEYVFRSGSIDLRFRSQTTLLEGTRAHQKIQKTYQAGDQKEIFLKTEVSYEDIKFLIEGRCDGLLFRDDTVTIDEIKSTSQPIEQIEEGYEVHWAQAKMYAYMYSKDHQLEQINVQLTYVQTETEEKRYFNKTYIFSDLEKFVQTIIKSYAPFAKLQSEHRQQRDESIKNMPFPFEVYRKGQRKLAGAVYKTILDEKSIFAEAPTGIGKTISTLFPTVKGMGEGLLNRIFYLTAKTITRTAAEEALEKMASCGLHLKSVTITAKDKVCFQEETICQKEHCEFANGYYDRINEAIIDILSSENHLTRDVIEKYARKHTVCPFEYSLDLAYAVDAIICDYNYIFDPKVSLKRLLEEQKKSTVLLVDEAHNLVDRGREMFSSTIHKESFLQLKKEFKGVDASINQAASQINSSFVSIRKADEKQFIIQQLDEDFIQQLKQFISVAEPVLQNKNTPNLLETYFTVQQFLKITELLDENYVIFAEKNKNDLTIKLFCLDPSKLLKQMSKGFRSKIFFSATLSPLQYYQDILGWQEGDYALHLPSPFHIEQTDVYIKSLSTRYRDRDRSLTPIVGLIQSLLGRRPGNYLIFFPSYQYLQAVYDKFKADHPETNTLCQTTGMTEAEREEFLHAFQPNQQETLVGFAVLGGIFSEGVDLIGDRLNGVVIIGVGLPQLCFERNLIKDHFYKKEKNGYDYAYVFPGMNKVLQAGGRLIRSETDEGTIVLVDDRFLQHPYQGLLPDEWRHYTVLIG